MVWCQGETDGDHNMSEAEYKVKLHSMLEAMFNNDIETCFLIRIGNHRDNEQQYQDIMQAQTDYCLSNENVVLVSTRFEEMAKSNLMKDPYHYEQEAYNIVGTEAGTNTAFYILKNSNFPYRF